MCVYIYIYIHVTCVCICIPLIQGSPPHKVEDLPESVCPPICLSAKSISAHRYVVCTGDQDLCVCVSHPSALATKGLRLLRGVAWPMVLGWAFHSMKYAQRMRNTY